MKTLKYIRIGSFGLEKNQVNAIFPKEKITGGAPAYYFIKLRYDANAAKNAVSVRFSKRMGVARHSHRVFALELVGSRAAAVYLLLVQGELTEKSGAASQMRRTSKPF